MPIRNLVHAMLGCASRKLPPSRDRLVRAVDIGDLDLKEDPGRAEMQKRIEQAIDHMCAIPSPIPGYGEAMTAPCRDEAWASARPQMDGAVARANER
jgi:UrcA family protein